MKESIEDHQRKVREIKKSIAFDKQWFFKMFTRRDKEVEFYEWQVAQALKNKKKEFDRNTYMVK